jgi:hypothetical protein
MVLGLCPTITPSQPLSFQAHPQTQKRKKKQAFGRGFELVPGLHPAVLCLIVTPLCALACWLLAMALRCVPGVKRVL